MRAALSTLASLPSTGKKIAVLGDMLELGPISVAMHERVGEVAAEEGIDCVYTYGERGALISSRAAENGVSETGHFSDKAALARQLKRMVRPGDAVLLDVYKRQDRDTAMCASPTSPTPVSLQSCR